MGKDDRKLELTGKDGVEFAGRNEEFCRLVAKHFDRDYYLQTYPDVASTEFAPLEHWLNHGFRENRQFSKFVLVRSGTIARRSADRNWKLFHWCGADIALRVVPTVAPDIISQILNQGRHDTAILAAGLDVVKDLVPSDRENIHLNVAGLQQAVSRETEFLLLISKIATSSESDFLTALLGGLVDAGLGPIQTIVTDQESTDIGDWSAVPECFQSTHVVYWRDFWIEGPERVKLFQLAQLIRVLRPRVTIVANSRRGYETVARFGRSLLECTDLYCLYEGGAFSAEYLHRTLPFATALTDDDALADGWRKQYGTFLGHEVVPLPRHSAAALGDRVATLFTEA